MQQCHANVPAAARAQTGQHAQKFDGTNEIQEIKILSDWAYMWTKLTHSGGNSVARRSIHEAFRLHTFDSQEGKTANGYWCLMPICWLPTKTQIDKVK